MIIAFALFVMQHCIVRREIVWCWISCAICAIHFAMHCLKKEEKAYLLLDNYRGRVSCREYLPNKLVVDFLAQLNQECEEKNNM